MSKMNEEAKTTLRAAASIVEATKEKAKSEILATIAPEVQQIIEEEIEREIQAATLSESFEDIEDLENPIPEEEEEIVDEEIIEDDEEDLDADLAAPPESASEVESGDTEQISVEIDGVEYKGDFSPGDEVLELEIVDGDMGESGLEPESDELLDAGSDPEVLDTAEAGLEEDDDLDIDLIDDEEEELEESIKKAVSKKLNEECKEDSEEDDEEVELDEASLKGLVRDTILESIRKKRTSKPKRNLSERTKRLRKKTIGDKLQEEGLIPDSTSVSRTKLFENDQQRKEVFDEISRLL